MPIGTVYLAVEGKAETTASTPAETLTETVST